MDSNHPRNGVAEKKEPDPIPEVITSYIRQSGFINLDDIYGAPAGHRYYPYQITVHLQGGKTETVLFRSNPQFAGKPEAFKKVEKFLKSLLLSAEKKQE